MRCRTPPKRPIAPHGGALRALFWGPAGLFVLQALPLNGKIVLRPPKALSEEPQQTAGKDNVRPIKNRREK
jgi:hypothetical protein